MRTFKNYLASYEFRIVWDFFKDTCEYKKGYGLKEKDRKTIHYK